MARLIDADALRSNIYCCCIETYNEKLTIVEQINEAPTVDSVPVEKYNELREAFVDYVCSCVNNQAPYCKNRIDGVCVDERGWCTYRHCRGFNPDGERKDGYGNG